MTTTEKEQKLGEWQRQWRILAETINAGWCAARRNSCHLKVNDSPDSTLNSGKGAVQLGEQETSNKMSGSTSEAMLNAQKGNELSKRVESASDAACKHTYAYLHIEEANMRA
ncbi:unnamed protein product [Ceratitis capitata]|uniref:(Mediterranean fruit fly) hypothetical protein n=1 Tax=Ceratitis capitata TaxID=7213 RepID=A0A811TYR1_CERCA|nr:unnamed protein product [Ceratitis capitata]